MKQKISFPFFTRQGMQVADSVATEVMSNISRGHNFLAEGEKRFRPVCLSIEAKKKENGEARIRAHYEDGVVVIVDMVNEADDQDYNIDEIWWVYAVNTRYYEYEGYRKKDEKVFREFTLEELHQLKDHRLFGWWHPNVFIK